MLYLHGGYDNTFAKIEATLQGQTMGYQTIVELQPQDAFGVRDESLLQTIPKFFLTPNLAFGARLAGQAGLQAGLRDKMFDCGGQHLAQHALPFFSIEAKSRKGHIDAVTRGGDGRSGIDHAARRMQVRTKVCTFLI